MLLENFAHHYLYCLTLLKLLDIVVENEHVLIYFYENSSWN